MKTSRVMKMMPPQAGDAPSIAGHMQEILELIGEDPAREGLLDTPQRADKALRFLTSGYQTSVADVVGKALFTADCDEMVVIKDI